MLGPYLAVFRIRIIQLLQYRTAALAGFVTQCWWGAMRTMVLAAFFAHGAAGQPISLAQSITYVWLGQACLMLIPWSVDPEATRLVRTGDIVYERLRPTDPWGYWMGRALARRMAQPLMRAIPMVVTAGVILPLVGLQDWSLRPPAGLDAAGLFALAILNAAVLSGTITCLMEVVVAATLSDRGVNMVMAPLTLLLSGNIIPLPLYPDWLRPILFVQPIAGLTDIPFRIYCGQLTGVWALAGIGLQLGWIGALSLLGRAVMARTMARLQVQGG